MHCKRCSEDEVRWPSFEESFFGPRTSGSGCAVGPGVRAVPREEANRHHRLRDQQPGGAAQAPVDLAGRHYVLGPKIGVGDGLVYWGLRKEQVVCIHRH